MGAAAAASCSLVAQTKTFSPPSLPHLQRVLTCFSVEECFVLVHTCTHTHIHMMKMKTK
jgi:hypothetical protein